MAPLTGKVALVTGGSRGIGQAIAEGLANAGAAVAVNHVANRSAADRVVSGIQDAGGQAIAVGGDVSRTADVAGMVAAVDKAFGPVGILVNNAGITDAHRPWQEIDEEEWNRVLAVNLTSCYLTLKAVYPGMRAAGWGRIINISSVTVHLGQANLLHYVSAKAGMIGFTRTLAREVGADGITVNAVTPGAIQTDSELEMFPAQDALAERMNQVQAVKRRGLPDDIAGAVAFLASDAASFITGQTLNIDGGWAMP